MTLMALNGKLGFRTSARDAAWGGSGLSLLITSKILASSSKRGGSLGERQSPNFFR